MLRSPLQDMEPRRELRRREAALTNDARSRISFVLSRPPFPAQPCHLHPCARRQCWSSRQPRLYLVRPLHRWAGRPTFPFFFPIPRYTTRRARDFVRVVLGIPPYHTALEEAGRLLSLSVPFEPARWFVESFLACFSDTLPFSPPRSGTMPTTFVVLLPGRQPSILSL